MCFSAKVHLATGRGSRILAVLLQQGEEAPNNGQPGGQGLAEGWEHCHGSGQPQRAAAGLPEEPDISGRTNGQTGCHQDDRQLADGQAEPEANGRQVSVGRCVKSI